MGLFKKDHYVFGLLVGILTPAILFAVIYGINSLLIVLGIAQQTIDVQTHVFVSLFGNLLPIRYYFVTLTYDKTGRGVLIVTFAVVLIFFSFKDFLFTLS